MGIKMPSLLTSVSFA